MMIMMNSVISKIGLGTYRNKCKIIFKKTWIQELINYFTYFSQSSHLALECSVPVGLSLLI